MSMPPHQGMLSSGWGLASRLDGSGVKNTEPGPKVTPTVYPFTTCTGEQTGVRYLPAKHQLSTKSTISSAGPSDYFSK